MAKDFLRVRPALVVGAALLLGGGFLLPAAAQTAAPAAVSATGPAAARAVIEARKAVFTLIAASFRPLGEVVKGNKPYDAAEVQKRIARIVFLSEFLDESFPDFSNTGLPDTKTKADAWTGHDDFAKKIKSFQDASAALQKVNATEKGATDAFKTAVGALGQECKGCHDTYKEK